MSSDRLRSLSPYIFSELDARRTAARRDGRTLVDLGIGSPDLPIPGIVIDAMRSIVQDPGLSGYPPFRAHPHFSDIVNQYMVDRFGVDLQVNEGPVALAGSKEGIAELLLAWCNPGDVVLVPAIHYPVYARATQLAGATPWFVPMSADGRLDLEAIPRETVARARALMVNYPANPTTVAVSIDELARLVGFAAANDLLLMSDLAYSEMAFDGFRVPSVLELPGARDVAVEFHSCSKSFSMAGFRIGFVAGRPEAIAALEAYRMTIGYGVSTVAQLAGATAFASHRALVPPMVAAYRERRDAMVAAFREAGWDVNPPRATMYLWLPVPDGFDDWSWVDALIRGPGVVVTPGSAFGSAGREHFRISLVRPPAVLADAASAIVACARQHA